MDDGVRCRKAGTGNPVLCQEHTPQPQLDVFTIAVEQLLNHPTMKRWADGTESWVRTKVAYVDHLLSGVPGAPGGFPRGFAGAPPPTQGPRPGRPPGAPPPRPPVEDPRVILHFGPREPLTIEKVKERKKLLATMVHPDKGGDTEAMAKINRAAEALLKNLKR